MRRLVAAALLALSLPTPAWDDHALVTLAALEDVPAVARAAPVAAEPLEAFLRAEGPRIARALDDEDRWERASLPDVPRRPDGLRFDPSAADPRTSFLSALRVNPRLPLAPFVQRLPGREGGRPDVAWSGIATLATAPHPGRVSFAALRAGEPVAPLDVVATASDEPDYGLDLGLFSDSGTAWGARYGFGRLPFGNPRLEFSTQAPFHMGFFHEPSWLYRLAPFLRHTFPELRIHQCATLARVAFETGHPYWGWRFLGWGLHYVQDLGQPYHAAPIPGTPRAVALLKNAIAMAGVHGPKDRMVQLVSNRHLALEAMAFEDLWRELSGGEGPVVRALRGPGDEEPWREEDPRAVIAAKAARRADATDRAVERFLPPRWTEDPSFRAGEAGFALDPAALTGEQRARFAGVLAELLRDVGAHTRRYVAAAAAR